MAGTLALEGFRIYKQIFPKDFKVKINNGPGNCRDPSLTF